MPEIRVRRNRLALLALLALGWSNQAAETEKFVLAITRFDGRLVPFAAFDVGRWQRAWPEADEAIEAEIKVDEVPSIWRKRGERVPRKWNLWRAAGGGRVEAHVNGVELVDAHCVAQVALTTDLSPAGGEHPLKLGVAVDANIPIMSIEEVRGSDPQWKQAEQAIVTSFSRREAAEAKARSEPLLREEPAPVAEVFALYREAKSPRSPLYFVAEKEYRTSRHQDPDCTALTILTGWLMPTKSRSFALLDPKVFLTDCDAKEARTAWPIAALQVSSRRFWVLQEHGYEDETYLVAEVSAAGIRYWIDVNGGGC